jgi:hypothetical protein
LSPRLSANARAAIMTVFQLDAPVELVFVDLQKQEQTMPAFLKMNPNHRVPVLEDGDFHLWESRAIMQYLAGVGSVAEVGAAGSRRLMKDLKPDGSMMGVLLRRSECSILISNLPPLPNFR